MQIKRGFTLIEMAIVLAILGTMLAVGVPALQNWIINTRVRTAAESVFDGIRKARSMALGRNYNIGVRWSMVNKLDKQCELQSDGDHWLISLDDPSNKCDAALTANPDLDKEAQKPWLLDRWSGSNYASSVQFNADLAAIQFNGLGRAIDPTPDSPQPFPVNIKISRQDEKCERPGCSFRVTVSRAGQVRLCDQRAAPGTFGAC